jgi:prepilin peptidase CpaA
MFTLPYELSALYALLIGASLYDIRERRVPNALNVALTLGGLTYRVMSVGPSGLLEGLLGVGMALALLLIPFMLYVYRGGDVKLCMGVGAWLGWEPALWVVVYGVLIGGVFGLSQLLLGKVKAQVEPAQAAQTVPMALAFTLAVLIITHTP